VGEVMILAKPTPEANNAAAIAPALIEPPRFSHESGFYAEEFTLSLSHPDENVTIYYTLDGSEPDPENLEGSTYRYKNSYQQPPKEEGQIIEISQDFLYNEYKTHRYEQPIQITDRTYESDRISQISTTFDEEPDYFPRPEEADHWVNDLIKITNSTIFQLNRFSRAINRLGVRVERKIKELLSGQKQQLGNRVFAVKVPEIEYRKYKEPRRYTFKGTPVRAVAVKENDHRRTISPIATNTYFIGHRDEFSLPIIAITVPEKDLFDYDEGIFVAGKDYDDFLLKGKDVKGAKHQRPANWKRRGTDKLAANIEIYEQSEDLAIINTPILTNIHGNSTRSARNTSFRLYPSGKRGLSHAFFDDGQLTGFRRINLRNSGNGGDAYFKDAVIHRILSGLAFGVQKYEPQIAFLNGEYYGILNARERRDGIYLEHNYGVEQDKIDLIKDNQKAQIGDIEHWDAFIALIDDMNAESDDFYEDVGHLIDIKSFIDFYGSSIYLSRGDWPSNNNAYWRSTQQQSVLTGDGRWRWLLYDADDAMSSTDYNRLKFATKKGGTTWPNPDWATKPLRTLLKNPEIRNQFIIRLADLINSTFVPERIIEFIREAKSGIEKEMPRHIDRWKVPRSMNRWRQHIDSLVDFAKKRPAIQRQHLQEFFDLGDLYTLDINVVLEDANGHQTPMDKGAIIRLNTLTLGVSDDELQKPVAASARATNMEKYLALPWSGEYFAGMPIELSVEPRAGYKFERWEGESLSRSQRNALELELIPESDLSLKVVLSPLQ